MNIDDNDTDDHDADHGNGIASFLELLAEAIIAARDLALSAKIKPAEIKKRAKFERGLVDIQARCAALTAHAEQTKAALDERAAELDAHEAETERRATEREASLREAYDHLRGYYDRIAEADRHLRYRLLSYANLLHGYNARLQDLPDWPAIKQMIPGLPPDLPVTPPAETAVREVTTDWTGHTFIAGSTLTRSVPQ
jgi:hypothetical protein